MLERIIALARDFGVLPGDCYETIVVQGRYTDKQCVTVALSKAIGFAIIGASAVLKLPQIIKIVAAKSAKGLSPAMYLLEIYALSVTVAFAVRTGIPFSSFGESCFILAQNFIILALLWKYLGSSRSIFVWYFFAAAYAVFAYVLTGAGISQDHLQLLRRSCVFAFAASKVPQILTNFMSKGTGQLSLITQGLQTAGNVARIATTFGDPGAFNWTVLLDLLLSFSLNAVLTTQILYYGCMKPKDVKDQKKKKQ